MSQYFTLRAGDVVLTGTPEGVGPMRSGDKLEISLAGHGISTRVL
jgi:2-keto-4-pentenoate hydratase/2-oxohepta-3-ene-1,7-dioic acid hydratase in catechol pathway